MGHRAVVLADLHTVDRSADPRGGGDVAGLGQRAGDPLGGRLDIGVRRRCRPPRHRPGSRRCAAGRTSEPPPHRRFRAVAAWPRPPGRRRRGRAWPGRPRSAGNRLAGRPRPACCHAAAASGLGVARLDQRVEVTPHPGGRQAQPVADLTGGDRSGLQQQAHDGAAGVTVRHQPGAATAAAGSRAGFSQHQCDAIPAIGLARVPCCAGLRWSHHAPALRDMPLRCSDGSPPPHAELVDRQLARRRAGGGLAAERYRAHRASAHPAVRRHRHRADGDRRPGRRGPARRPGPHVRGPAAQPAVADPDRVVDDDDDRCGHDGAGLVDAGPVRAGQAADVARRPGPHAAVVGRCRC